MSSARLKWYTQTVGTVHGKFQKILKKPHPSECRLYPGREDGRSNVGYGASTQILTHYEMEKPYSQVILPRTEEASKFAAI